MKQQKPSIKPSPCEGCTTTSACGKTRGAWIEWYVEAWNQVCAPFRKLAAQRKG